MIDIYNQTRKNRSYIQSIYLLEKHKKSGFFRFFFFESRKIKEFSWNLLELGEFFKKFSLFDNCTYVSISVYVFNIL